MDQKAVASSGRSPGRADSCVRSGRWKCDPENQIANIEFVINECYSRNMGIEHNSIRDTAHLREALGLLGSLLAASGHELAVAVIGGSALLLGGRGQRVTRDVDVVAFVDGGVLTASSPNVELLARYVSGTALELELAPNWLNSGPISLLEVGLPEGFLSRCSVEQFGGLTVHVADRYDLIHTKLYAAADQGPQSKHMADLRALDPTPEELDAAREWCCHQDVSGPFAQEVDEAVRWALRRDHE